MTIKLTWYNEKTKERIINKTFNIALNLWLKNLKVLRYDTQISEPDITDRGWQRVI